MRVSKPRRLRRRKLTDYLGVAMVTAMFCAAFIAARPAPQPIKEFQVVSEDDSISIPVPTRSIARGEKISQVEFLSTRWPKSKVSGAFITAPADYKNSYALTSLPAHLPIPAAALSSAPLDANAVAEAIPAGMRAITVKVDAESAVEGWARSGNFVDVILVRSSRDAPGGLESLVISENVKILSAGASAQPVGGSENSAKAPNTVTLLVSQEDALRIKAAANIGRLTFALRGTGDVAPTLMVSVDQRKLLGTQIIEKKSPDYVGRARGPDGRTYVLAHNSRWLRSSEDVAGFRGDDQ